MNGPFAVINGAEHFGLSAAALVHAHLNGFTVVGVAPEVLAMLGREELARVARNLMVHGPRFALLCTTARFRELLAHFHPEVTPHLERAA